LEELDQADNADTDPDEPGPSAAELREKIKTLTERKAKYQKLYEGLKESGAKQVSLTDPDARSMVMHHGSTEVGYNVQTVVDEQHQLIVEHEVTNDPTDHAHLAEMARRAKETLAVEKLEVVADMGYYDGAEVKQRARRITRWVDEKFLEDMARRVRARPELIRRRQQLSEPPFGTIKRAMGHSYFLMRGLNKVGAEMSLTVLSYNLKRAINILGVKKLIEALT